MSLYLKQRVFSWGDKFSVYDENGAVRYSVEGEIFTFGKKLHVYDAAGNEVIFIRQKLMSFLPRYYISRHGEDIAEVVKEFTFFRHEYTVDAFGWSVHGDFFDHDYEIRGAGGTVVTVAKEWLSWGDTYHIDIAPGVDEIHALAVVLVIDACIEAENND